MINIDAQMRLELAYLKSIQADEKDIERKNSRGDSTGA